jgi:hypothetical protein
MDHRMQVLERTATVQHLPLDAVCGEMRGADRRDTSDWRPSSRVQPRGRAAGMFPNDEDFDGEEFHRLNA